MLTTAIRSAFVLLYCAGSATAQDTPSAASHCIAVADAAPGISYVQNASFQLPVPEGDVRISYITHASFLIQAEGGTDAITDFTGFIGNIDFLPDVVTMNHAHSTHWTAFPDPAIPHVLKGWGEAFGEGVDHYLDLGDMVIRNVSTDIRSAFGNVTEPQGNSIFVFEAAGLCIGHLGHLHHQLTELQYAALGRVDVLLAPVDGGFTLPLDEMVDVIGRLKSSIVIPMHWFTEGNLSRFLARMEGRFDVVQTDNTMLTVSLRTLPSTPTIMVLRPRLLSDNN